MTWSSEASCWQRDSGSLAWTFSSAGCCWPAPLYLEINSVSLSKKSEIQALALVGTFASSPAWDLAASFFLRILYTFFVTWCTLRQGPGSIRNDPKPQDFAIMQAYANIFWKMTTNMYIIYNYIYIYVCMYIIEICESEKTTLWQSPPRGPWPR